MKRVPLKDHEGESVMSTNFLVLSVLVEITDMDFWTLADIALWDIGRHRALNFGILKGITPAHVNGNQNGTLRCQIEDKNNCQMENKRFNPFN